MKNKPPFISENLKTKAIELLEKQPLTATEFWEKLNLTEEIGRELSWQLIQSKQVSLTNDWKLTTDFKIYIDV